MSLPKIDIHPVLNIARAAGKILMDYRGKVNADYKGDNSPVTAADRASSDLVIEQLKALTPGILVISEEQDMDLNRKIAGSAETYWVTDPLDGTKSYIDGYDGFGVHIALVHNGVPVMGVAFFPAQEGGLGKIYYTGNDAKAYVQVGQNTPQMMQVSKKSSDKIKTAMGWKDLPFNEMAHPVRAVGGARLCVTAEKQAEIAQFNAPFSFWDVAAGHAIIRAAGGDFLCKKTLKAVRYDNDSLITPPAFGGDVKLLKRVFGNNLKRGPRAS